MAPASVDLQIVVLLQRYASATVTVRVYDVPIFVCELVTVPFVRFAQVVLTAILFSIASLAIDQAIEYCSPCRASRNENERTFIIAGTNIPTNPTAIISSIKVNPKDRLILFQTNKTIFRHGDDAFHDI